jgi:excisionase family DNA binding protein
MTLEEVSTYLRVSKGTIYNLIKNGRIPVTKIGGQWRFQKETIDKWLKDTENNLELSVKSTATN